VAARGDHANATAAEIVSAGRRGEAVSLDVTDAEAVQRLPADIVDRHGRLDIVVSNAGVTRDQLLVRMKREDWEAVIATNLTATFTLAQSAMRPMLKQRGGRIIAVSSVVGQMGNAGQTNYAASEAGLIGCQALAREVASRGSPWNVIAPGMIDTDMTRAATERAQVDWAQQIPSGASDRWTMLPRPRAILHRTRRRILQGTFSPSTAECTCRRIEWPYRTKSRASSWSSSASMKKK
jgi:3-oxoacyl-[acyl-carrier protein] reductase